MTKVIFLSGISSLINHFPVTVRSFQQLYEFIAIITLYRLAKKKSARIRATENVWLTPLYDPCDYQQKGSIRESTVQGKAIYIYLHKKEKNEVNGMQKYVSSTHCVSSNVDATYSSYLRNTRLRLGTDSDFHQGCRSRRRFMKKNNGNVSISVRLSCNSSPNAFYR